MQPYTEEQLARMEGALDPASIPELVRTVREQQHDLERLRMSLDVARRDREELRAALLGAQEELRKLRGG